MQNEFIAGKFEYKTCTIDKSRAITKLKQIGHESLFYFALFLCAFILFQSLPLITGFFIGKPIGINEVIVSVLGFTNVFIYKVYNKLHNKN